MRKCFFCLCRTCIKADCNCKNCIEKIEFCENYSGFRQMSIFERQPAPTNQPAPRRSLEHYGITKERYGQLTEYIQSGKYASLASQAAHTANKDVAEYILLSVKENLSYDGLEKLWCRGEIERIPYCRTDFYGWRRYTMHLFDLEMRRIEK